MGEDCAWALDIVEEEDQKAAQQKGLPFTCEMDVMMSTRTCFDLSADECQACADNFFGEDDACTIVDAFLLEEAENDSEGDEGDENAEEKRLRPMNKGSGGPAETEFISTLGAPCMFAMMLEEPEINFYGSCAEQGYNGDDFFFGEYHTHCNTMGPTDPEPTDPSSELSCSECLQRYTDQESGNGCPALVTMFEGMMQEDMSAFDSGRTDMMSLMGEDCAWALDIVEEEDQKAAQQKGLPFTCEMDVMMSTRTCFDLSADECQACADNFFGEDDACTIVDAFLLEEAENDSEGDEGDENAEEKRLRPMNKGSGGPAETEFISTLGAPCMFAVMLEKPEINFYGSCVEQGYNGDFFFGEYNTHCSVEAVEPLE